MTDTTGVILPPPPPEPPRNSDISALAPGFQYRLGLTLKSANAALVGRKIPYRFAVFEGLRTNERQAWLFASGRTYRGEWRTNAQSAEYSWHGFGLAADCVPRPVKADGTLGDWTWSVPAVVWDVLFVAATNNGCTTGRDWKDAQGRAKPDSDHVQPSGVKVSPSSQSRDAYHSSGLAEVWRLTGLDK